VKIGKKKDDLPSIDEFEGYSRELLCDPGTYPAIVLACKDHQSANGNDTFEAKVGVDSPQGGVLCTHYAVRGQVSLSRWLKAFGYDLEKLDDDVEIEASSFVQKPLKVVVQVEEDENGKYAPKMKIQAVYPPDKAASATPKKAAPAAAKKPAKVAAAKPGDVQPDDAPF
jgi:hypothetical protein